MLGFLDRFESVHVGTDEKCRLNAVNFWVGKMAILMENRVALEMGNLFWLWHREETHSDLVTE